MLRVESLSVSYGRLVVVHDVGFRVEGGEVVGLVGPNAAGKTTTLMAVAGALPARAGSVTLDGEDIGSRRPEDRVKAGLCLVPEGRRVLAALSVDENLQLGAISRPANSALRREIDEMYERFPAIAAHRHSAAGSLSGGEQQQLAIARALMARPRVLMIDEASLGLSPVAVEAVYEILGELRTEGTAILIVEHDLERIAAIADRVYGIAEGTSLELGPAATIDPAQVEALYLGERSDAKPIGSEAGA